MSVTLAYANQAVIEAHAMLETVKAKYEEACKQLADLCPHQVGDIASVGYFNNDAAPMFIERINVSVETLNNANKGKAIWHLIGKKVTKAGKAHATAQAYGTMVVANTLDAEERKAARKAHKQAEWDAGEAALSQAERLDLDIERGAARKLRDDTFELQSVTREVLLEIAKLIDLGEENANDTLLIEKEISTSTWADTMRGTIGTMLAFNTYHRHTVLFFGSRGIKG